MRYLYIILISLFIFSGSISAKKNSESTVTTTFFVMMRTKDDAKSIKKMLKDQEGIKKYDFDTKKQIIVVDFNAEKNTVSNLLKQFRAIKVTATAMETSCFGSKEGCINATKPENIMP